MSSALIKLLTHKPGMSFPSPAIYLNKNMNGGLFTEVNTVTLIINSKAISSTLGQKYLKLETVNSNSHKELMCWNAHMFQSNDKSLSSQAHRNNILLITQLKWDQLQIQTSNLGTS